MVAEKTETELPSPTKIRPGIVMQDGSTIYPTGDEWIVAWAIRGTPWAVEAFKQRMAQVEEANMDEIHKMATD